MKKNSNLDFYYFYVRYSEVIKLDLGEEAYCGKNIYAQEIDSNKMHFAGKSIFLMLYKFQIC